MNIDGSAVSINPVAQWYSALVEIDGSLVRVGIKPGFYHKAQPAGFMRAGFGGVLGFMWVL